MLAQVPGDMLRQRQPLRFAGEVFLELLRVTVPQFEHDIVEKLVELLRAQAVEIDAVALGHALISIAASMFATDQPFTFIASLVK
jgi:hypothetical protein